MHTHSAVPSGSTLVINRLVSIPLSKFILSSLRLSLKGGTLAGSLPKTRHAVSLEVRVIRLLPPNDQISCCTPLANSSETEQYSNPRLPLLLPSVSKSP